MHNQAKRCMGIGFNRFSESICTELCQQGHQVVAEL